MLLPVALPLRLYASQHPGKGKPETHVKENHHWVLTKPQGLRQPRANSKDYRGQRTHQPHSKQNWQSAQDHHYRLSVASGQGKKACIEGFDIKKTERKNQQSQKNEPLDFCQSIVDVPALQFPDRQTCTDRQQSRQNPNDPPHFRSR